MTQEWSYDHRALEARWQRIWRDEHAFDVPPPSPDRPDVYVAAAPPFTSGALHMGHVRSYTLADVQARYRRALGDAVLWSVGFDSFGLPAEIAALKRKIPPSRWVAECVATMKQQLEQLGVSGDWDRSFVTSDPATYRWSQWLFLKLYEHGLVYKQRAPVAWCETCQSVLARLQIEDGGCWRCHNPIEIIVSEEWFLRINAFIDELYDDALPSDPRNDQAWLKHHRTMLGKTKGVEVEFVADSGGALKVFTKDPSQLNEGEFLLIGLNHPDIRRWFSDPSVSESVEQARADAIWRASRSARDVEVHPTGHVLRIPGTDFALPLAVSPLVDLDHNSGECILGLPRSNRSHEIIRRRLGLERREEPARLGRVPFEPAVRYRQKDIAISRRRMWGTPIPLVRCAGCGTVPVPESELPVRIPTTFVPTGENDSLENCPEFRPCKCPACGADAERETKTLDCFFDASWFWFLHCIPSAERDRPPFLSPHVLRWYPVDVGICGIDISVPLLLNRFAYRALRRMGYLAELGEELEEPIAEILMHEMVLVENRKMSKSLGNAVDPIELMQTYGADALRFTVLTGAAPTTTFNWNDSTLVLRSRRFLDRLWAFFDEHEAALDQRGLAPDAEIDGSDRFRKKLMSWAGTGMPRICEAYRAKNFHLAGSNLEQLFKMLARFVDEVREKRELDAADRQALAIVARDFLRVAAPLIPHLAEALWEKSHGEGRAGDPSPLWRELSRSGR